MKTCLPTLCLLALLTQAQSQSPPVSSSPVLGFYRFEAPVGTSLWTCGLVGKQAFQGKATSVTPGTPHSTLTRTDASWPGFPLHYVEILSGPQAGLILDIISNTATTLVIEGNTTALGLTGTETFCVRPHATLGNVFKDGAGLTAGQDTVTLIRETGRATYFYNGLSWEDSNLEDADNVILYPGQAFLINRGGSTGAVLTFGGNEIAFVKTGPTKIPLYPGIPNLVGLVNPLVSTNAADSFFPSSFTTLGDYGFLESLVAGNDSVQLRMNNGTLTSQGSFVSNGVYMEDNNLNDASPVPVRNGTGIIINVSVDSTWTAPAPRVTDQ